MSCSSYDLCCRYQGQVVQIREQSGREHVGRITQVSSDRVWIDPYFDNYPPRINNNYNDRNYQTNHYSHYGYGYPIAIGFISGIILASLFFF